MISIDRYRTGLISYYTNFYSGVLNTFADLGVDWSVVKRVSPANPKIRVDAGLDGVLVSIWEENLTEFNFDSAFEGRNTLDSIKKLFEELTLGTIRYEPVLLPGNRVSIVGSKITRVYQNPNFGWPEFTRAAFHTLHMIGYNDDGTLHISEEDAYSRGVAVAKAAVAENLSSTSLNGAREDGLRHLLERLKEFESLISTDVSEEEIQKFLKEESFILDTGALRVLPKFPMGTKHVTDFVLEMPSQNYKLVELERSSHRLFTKDGNPTAALTHAQRQIRDWLTFCREEITYIRNNGLQGITEPRGVIIIGRRSSLNADDSTRLREINAESSKISILTYDDLIAICRQQITNLMSVIDATRIT